MCPTWSAGVFFIYGTVLLPSAPDDLPHIRAPPLTAPNSGQTPEASPGAASAVMRDAHVRAIRQRTSRGLSIEEIASSPEKQKSRRAATQRLLAELCSYARNVRTTVTVRFLVVNNESAVFVFFRAGRKKKWRRLPQREIFTAQFFHSLFCKSLLRLEQKPCTLFYVTMHLRKTIAGLHRQHLPKDFHAASAASKTTLLSLSEKNSFL